MIDCLKLVNIGSQLLFIYLKLIVCFVACIAQEKRGCQEDEERQIDRSDYEPDEFHIYFYGQNLNNLKRKSFFFYSNCFAYSHRLKMIADQSPRFNSLFHHDLTPIHDVHALGGSIHAAALQVIDWSGGNFFTLNS